MEKKKKVAKVVSTTGKEIRQKEILTAEETMQLLGISRNTFDRFKRDGRIKVYRLGRRLYCKYSQIIETLENGLLEVA